MIQLCILVGLTVSTVQLELNSGCESIVYVYLVSNHLITAHCNPIVQTSMLDHERIAQTS